MVYVWKIFKTIYKENVIIQGLIISLLAPYNPDFPIYYLWMKNCQPCIFSRISAHSLKWDGDWIYLLYICHSLPSERLNSKGRGVVDRELPGAYWHPPQTWRDSIFLVRYDVPLMKSTGKKRKIGLLQIYVKIIFILPKKPKKM